MEHIGKILGLCKGISWIAPEAKSKRKKCRQLAERVKDLEQLVEAIKQRGPGQISPDVEKALWKLSMTLTAGHELVRKCAKTKYVNLVKCGSEFNSVNEGLRDTYHFLAGAAQVDPWSMKSRMLQGFALDRDDDDDSDDGLGHFGALAPVRYSPAAAPSLYHAAAAPRLHPAIAYVAMMEMGNDVVRCTRSYFPAQ